MSPNLLKHFSKNYRIAVRYMDDRLGALFRAIDTSPDGKNTIVAIVGDHGEQFGEHHLLLHGNSVSRQVLYVPFALRGPGIDRGRVRQPVSTAWLYSALLRAARIRTSVPHVLPYTADAAVPPVLSLHEPSMRDERVPSPITERCWSVFEKNMHFIRGERGREEMYQVDTDPEEFDNIVIRERIQPQRVQLRRSLLDRFATRNGIREKQRQFRSLGYMQ